MVRLLLIWALLLTAINLTAQNTVKGKVTGNEKEIIAGANVYFKNTYEGTTTDSNGDFVLKTNLTGKQILIVSFIGFNNYEQEIDLNEKNQNLAIVLENSAKMLEGVTINAGSFEASDKNKSITLRPLDIVTTPSANGDIYGSLNSLPGTTKVAESGQLFVRGGDNYETKTYIDGMLVASPYQSSMPDLPSRGRFSPFLFGGTTFSTGGYSAEYGQALSSALILNTSTLTQRNMASLSFMTVGVGAGYTNTTDKNGISVSFDYSNLEPYFRAVKQRVTWKTFPQSLGGTLVHQQKINENDMVKTFVSVSHTKFGLHYPTYITDNSFINILKTNDNGFIKSTLNHKINTNWDLKTGISATYDRENTQNDENFEQNELNKYLQLRSVITNEASSSFLFKAGVEYNFSDHENQFKNLQQNQSLTNNFKNQTSAAFAESEWKITRLFAARIGTRAEYSILNNEFNIVPRVSVASKITSKSQISVAYGIFYQLPENSYFETTKNLNSQKATHYIFNYQYMPEGRTLRIEGYYKQYNDLIKNNSEANYNNKGNGYARGIDIFWRDWKSIKNAEYWISYSYIDSKRNYLNFPVSATPDFISNHNFNAVVKWFVPVLHTQFGASYGFSTGRPYYNPNNPEFMSDRTPQYHDLSMNASYLTSIFGNFTIVYCSVSNVLGANNISGYRFSPAPSENGTFQAFEIKPEAKRFFFIGVFISIGK